MIFLLLCVKHCVYSYFTCFTRLWIVYTSASQNYEVFYWSSLTRRVFRSLPVIFNNVFLKYQQAVYSNRWIWSHCLYNYYIIIWNYYKITVKHPRRYLSRFMVGFCWGKWTFPLFGDYPSEITYTMSEGLLADSQRQRSGICGCQRYGFVPNFFVTWRSVPSVFKEFGLCTSG